MFGFRIRGFFTPVVMPVFLYSGCEWTGASVFIWTLQQHASSFVLWRLPGGLLNSWLIIMVCRLKCLIQQNEISWVHYSLQFNSFQWHLVFSFMYPDKPCWVLVLFFSSFTFNTLVPGICPIQTQHTPVVSAHSSSLCIWTQTTIKYHK